MYYKVQDFINDWKDESGATLKTFGGLTDESLNKKFNEHVRTLGRLAWHITGAIPEMMNRTGLQIEGPESNSEVPASAAKIVEAYKKSSNSLSEAVEKNWTDQALSEKVNMYGEDWEKGKVLSILIVHQIHHRAQMTVVMRFCGLKVPGIYGPANEEWAQMGMPPEE